MASDSRGGPASVDSSADTLAEVSDTATTLALARGERAGAGRGEEATAPTLAAASSGSDPGHVDPGSGSFEPTSSVARYEARRLLGEGGMGEVRLCRDGWIGREVAMKVVHRGKGSRADLRARFLREVRVQGQLEHPSVVPVYDLGVGADGQTFFTMKRVRGQSLETIVDDIRRGDPAARAAFSRRKLLSAMAHVSLAVAFAHSRGVVHRDLKPANVMLGDFGEVYVLDWGIAKIVGTPDEASPDAAADVTDGPRTEAGALLGTPGYMAPEQARGDVGAVDARSDVYALGAILFEVLALEPLHTGRTAQAILAATLQGIDPRPSARAPAADIPPELDAICERALALDPEQRFAGARELDLAIEAFLDGERDSERRRELADRHIAAARTALARAGEGGASAHALRTDATRELGRALALDPQNRGAMRELMNVILDAPGDLPPEAEAELAEVNRRHRARQAKASAAQFAAWFLASPIILWMGVRDWRFMGILEVLVAAIIAYSWWMGRTGNAQPRYMVFAIPLSFAAVALLTGFFGPFVVVPGAVAVSAVMFLVSLRPNLQTRWLILGLSLAASGLPLLAHWLGLVAPSYEIREGAITLYPQLTHFPVVPTSVLLAVVSLGTPLVANLMVGRSVAQLIAAERRMFAQAWRLRQLLPAGEGEVAAGLQEQEAESCHLL